MSVNSIESLTLQETVLATAMVRHVGNVATDYAIRGDARVHDVSRQEVIQSDLIDQFRQDPKDSLAWARETLLAIAGDQRISADSRDRRLSRYLDAYTSLTTKLDQQAFPATKPNEVRSGTPEYIPNGFNDLGRERNLDPKGRSREMIHVDKQAVFEQYGTVLKDVFNFDYSQYTLQQRKQRMATILAKAVYIKMPYDHSLKDLGGDKLNLAELNEGVCRHQALVFQVLSQAVGLKTRLLKTEMISEGKMLGYHSTNMIRLSGKWYILDVTNPDVETLEGKRKWRPGIIRIPEPPKNGDITTYEGKLKHTGIKRGYRAHNRMFWTID